MTARIPTHAVDPGGVPDGDYVVTVSGGVVTGLTTAPSGGGGSVAVEDEGTEIIAAATRLNFTGAGVTVTDAGSGEATVTIPGGGSGTTESYEDVVALLPDKVHRWKFEEASGATIADSIGTLNLTLTGTAGTNYNRNISGPAGLGQATQFISSHADSSGIGSVPVGAANRTIIFVFRTSSQARQVPFGYGTAAAYQLFYPGLNDNGSAASLGHFSPSVGGAGDLLDMPNAPISDGAWHMGAIGLRGGNGKSRFGYIDGIYAQGTYSTAANTISSGPFRVGLTVDNVFQFVGDIADIIVCNQGLSRRWLDRLFTAAALVT